MIENKPLLLTGLAALGAGCAAPDSVRAAEPARDKRPNVIVIYCDDMGYGDVGCFGGEYTPTPNLDRMASQGTRFTHYYSAAPVSSPSRVGITTGMFPLEWQFTNFQNNRKANRNCEQVDFLDANAPSMARAFQQAGYATGHFGKWHMGGGRDVDDAPGIPEYGFDEYSSTWESPDPDPIITSSNWIWADTDSVKRWDRTAYFVDRTIDFLQRHKGQPCFVNLWPDDMHTPWVPEQFAGQDNKWNSEEAFNPVLHEMDRQFGRLFEALEKMKIADNTIVIFTSDNGPAPSFQRRRTNGMRGQKLSNYEGGIRMPFIVRWPAKIPAGRVDTESVISAVDLYPTLCSMAGIPTEAGYKSDGCDASKAFLGEQPLTERPVLCWDFGRNKYFGFPREPHRSPHLAIREGDWKLLTNSDGSGLELYNIAEDPYETNNVAEKHPDIVARLQPQVIEWFTVNRQKFLDAHPDAPRELQK